MPATVTNWPRKCLIAVSDPITASDSLSVLRNTQQLRGMVSFTPSWVVPSQNTVRMRLSSSTDPRASETPVARRVGPAVVRQLDVVQRHLAGLERHPHRL